MFEAVIIAGATKKARHPEAAEPPSAQMRERVPEKMGEIWRVCELVRWRQDSVTRGSVPRGSGLTRRGRGRQDRSLRQFLALVSVALVVVTGCAKDPRPAAQPVPIDPAQVQQPLNSPRT